MCYDSVMTQLIEGPVQFERWWSWMRCHYADAAINITITHKIIRHTHFSFLSPYPIWNSFCKCFIFELLTLWISLEIDFVSKKYDYTCSSARYAAYCAGNVPKKYNRHTNFIWVIICSFSNISSRRTIFGVALNEKSKTTLIFLCQTV